MSIKTKLNGLETAVREKHEAKRLAGLDYLEVVGELLVNAGYAEDPREKFRREHPERNIPE
jgi:hypothetical protein